MLELIEGRIERTKGMTEETVPSVRRGWRRIFPDVMGALIVSDPNRMPRCIRIGVHVRQRYRAHTHAQEQHERDTSTLDPRPVDEHQFELTE